MMDSKFDVVIKALNGKARIEHEYLSIVEELYVYDYENILPLIKQIEKEFCKQRHCTTYIDKENKRYVFIIEHP